MILKVDHIGIAVKSLDDRVGFWRDGLGLELGGTETVPTEGVRVAFLPAGTSRVRSGRWPSRGRCCSAEAWR